MKKNRLLFGAALLLTAMLSCANPIGGGGNAPSQPGNVETIVAATLQALTAPAPQDSTGSLLPHSMYYLGNDGAGLLQVYRLEKDGKTVSQITFEPGKVDKYDVSLVDGSVVYISNNQLLTVNADGSNRSMIFDGGPQDQNNPFVNAVRSPVWSPNAQTIAFGYKGLNFYSIVTGQSNLVLKDDVNDAGSGLLIPRELFWPEKYTTDGSKLMISLGYYEGASAAIYYPNGGALVRLNGGEGALICCGDAEWTVDGSAFYSANPSPGMFSAGLWRVDAATGTVTTLLLGGFDTNPANLADEPFLAPDGQLYFFYSSVQPVGNANRPPLQIVRSAPDGVTNRTVLRPETFDDMNEALWAPDASFVIVANPAIQDIYAGGAAELYFTDGQKAMIPLVPFAEDMKWGP